MKQAFQIFFYKGDGVEGCIEVRGGVEVNNKSQLTDHGLPFFAEDLELCVELFSPVWPHFTRPLTGPLVDEKRLSSFSSSLSIQKTREKILLISDIFIAIYNTCSLNFCLTPGTLTFHVHRKITPSPFFFHFLQNKQSSRVINKTATVSYCLEILIFFETENQYVYIYYGDTGHINIQTF